MTEIWRIVFTRHISCKLIVNVNVSKMAFAQKKQVRLNREGGKYDNSRRHSQLLRDYVSDLHHAHIKDLDFLVVLRPRLRKGCRSQNQCINDKNLLIQKALSE